MNDTYYFEQLDQKTKAYLRDVKQAYGRGAPGIYFPISTYRPIWAFLIGIIVGPFLFFSAMTSTKHPVAVACLQTAGIMIGGWLVMYAIRRWTASSDKHAGWFFYFDPAHAYVGMGDQIDVVPLPGDTEVVPVGANGVQFESSHGTYTISVPTRIQAAIVADYYSAVDWVMSRQEGPWAGVSLAEVGAVARYLVENDQEPADILETNLSFTEIPEDVESVRSASFGFIPLIVIAGISACSFIFFASTNGARQDHAAFAKVEEAKQKYPMKPGKTAQNLREYLGNPRYTRHRNDANQMLITLYDDQIKLLNNNTVANAELKAGMIKILEELKTPETPAVSISVKDKTPGVFGTANQDELRMRFADGISTAVGGIQMLVCVQPPMDENGVSTDGMIAIEYQSNNDKISWTVKLKAKHDGETVATVSGAFNYRPVIDAPGWNIPVIIDPDDEPPLKKANTSPRDEIIYNEIMKQLLGQSPPQAIIPEEW